MNLETLLVKKEDNVATITINRPDRLNALSDLCIRELVATLDEVARDDEVRAVVLTGAGRAFSSGADVGQMSGGTQERAARSPEDIRRHFGPGPHGIILGLQRMEKPTIAMVNGVAVGAGFDIALACDMRVGSENARFMNAFVRIGLFPGFGGTWLYPRVMGLPKALQYLLTGDWVEAQEAYRIGVLNELVPAAELEPKTMALAKKLAKGPPIAIRLMKMQVYKGLEFDLETALKFAAACETITLTSEDHNEGVAAFREKREAQYKGR